MKKVFIRVSDTVSMEAAEKHMQSIGYNWKHGVQSYTEIPNYAQSLLGFTGRKDGELRGFSHQFYLENKIEEWEEISLNTNKHKHYNLIIQWANDPSQKVWWKTSVGWIKVDKPSWVEDFDYHIGEEPPLPKRKIMIGDVEIDAPEITPPKEYYVPMITETRLHVKYIWNGDTHDLLWLKRGLIHLTPEAAIAHAKALIKVSTIS